MSDSSGAPPQRLFLALDLPADTRSTLAAWLAGTLAGRDELRAVSEKALHVTLVFLGWTPPDAVRSVWSVASGAASTPAPRFEPSAVVAVPRNRPRLFALDLGDEDGRGAALQAQVAAALAAAGLYESERRPFWPHVTLARVRRGRGDARTPRRDARARVPGAEPPRLDPFVASTLALYRSHLSPRGARYEALERLSLSQT